MSSTILLGNNLEEKTKRIELILEKINLKIDENNPDLLFIDPEENKKSIGIGQIKQLNKFINEKPYSHKFKVVVISRGELLTTQAQNALLKNLEEHPNYVEILIGARNERDVLETVLSRCKRINLKEDMEQTSDSLDFRDFYKKTTGEKLDYIAELSKEDKTDILNTLDSWIAQSRNNISEFGAVNIENVIKIKNDLEKTNVNTKLALEFLATQLK